jgi:hypothetical protein
MSIRIFCSKQCAHDSTKKEKTIVRCEICDKEIEVLPCLLEQTKYCSKKCKWIGTRKIRDGLSRQCNQCKETKPLDCFGSTEYSRKHEYICKICRAKLSHARMRTTKGQFAACKHIAKRRKLEWNISEEEYTELRKMKCHYCYESLNETGTGLDRKDNSKGYILDNVVPCCCHCNRTRSDHFTYEEMLRLAVLIREIKRDRLNA